MLRFNVVYGGCRDCGEQRCARCQLSIAAGLEESRQDSQNVGGVNIGDAVTDDTFELALRAAAMLGVATIAAAGNCGDDSIVAYDEADGSPIRHYQTNNCSRRDEDRAPGYFSLQGHVIAVGAVDERGERIALSTASEVVDVAAPGEDILSTDWCLSANVCETREATGTSPATAYVSGVVAHMLNRHPGATVGQVRAALEHSAIAPRVPDPNSPPVRSELRAAVMATIGLFHVRLGVRAWNCGSCWCCGAVGSLVAGGGDPEGPSRRLCAGVGGQRAFVWSAGEWAGAVLG